MKKPILTAVRYASDIDSCLDFIVICSTENVEIVKALIEVGLNIWFDQGSQVWGGYADVMDYVLNSSNISYRLICHDANNTSEEYEKFWEDVAKQLYAMSM